MPYKKQEQMINQRTNEGVTQISKGIGILSFWNRVQQASVAGAVAFFARFNQPKML